MAGGSKLVALMFEGNTEWIKVVNADSEASRKRMGVSLDKSGKHWRYHSRGRYSVGKHRHFEQGEEVRGVIGLYNSMNNQHLTAMVEDSAYAKMIKFERAHDHD